MGVGRRDRLPPDTNIREGDKKSGRENGNERKTEKKRKKGKGER